MINTKGNSHLTKNTPARLLTTKEVREMTGLSKNTVLKLLNTGVLPGVKLGAQWFVREDELLETLSATKDGATCKDAI